MTYDGYKSKVVDELCKIWCRSRNSQFHATEIASKSDALIGYCYDNFDHDDFQIRVCAHACNIADHASKFPNKYDWNVNSCFELHLHACQTVRSIMDAAKSDFLTCSRTNKVALTLKSWIKHLWNS